MSDFLCTFINSHVMIRNIILLRFDRVDAIIVRDDEFRKCVQQNLYDLNSS